MLDDFEKGITRPMEGCPAIGRQDVSVCVPVEVKPFADVGKVKTKCIGKPMVDRDCDCEGKKKASCKFTITQKIAVDVPVIFGANTEVGEARIDCDCDCNRIN